MDHESDLCYVFVYSMDANNTIGLNKKDWEGRTPLRAHALQGLLEGSRNLAGRLEWVDCGFADHIRGTSDLASSAHCEGERTAENVEEDTEDNQGSQDHYLDDCPPVQDLAANILAASTLDRFQVADVHQCNDEEDQGGNGVNHLEQHQDTARHGTEGADRHARGDEHGQQQVDDRDRWVDLDEALVGVGGTSAADLLQLVNVCPRHCQKDDANETADN